MSEPESRPPEPQTRELQRLLSQEEAELLRQELARYLREEMSTGQLLEPLQDELRKALHQVRKEIREETLQQTERLRKELREEIRHRLKESSRSESRVVPEPPVQVEAPGSERRQKSTWDRDRLQRLFARTAIVFLSLIGLAVAGLYAFRIAQARGLFTDRHPEAPPATAQELAQLPITWVDLMVPVQTKLPMGGALRTRMGEQSLSQRYDCWFPENTAARLETLLTSDMAPEPFRIALREAFEPCAIKDGVPLQESPAVLGTQAAVHKVLSDKTRSGWKEWCPGEKTPSAAELKSFRLDGKPGVPSYKNLNLYLSCKGQAGRWIDSKSGPTDYLFVLYLALHDLRREPKAP